MKERKFYEAFDGTLFNTLEKCNEYEKNSKEKITEDFKKLIVRQGEGMKITEEGTAFPLAEIAECWWYGVIIMRDDNDYEILKKYAKSRNDKVEKIFNKEIFVCLGEGNKKECYYDPNYFYWYGTIDECVSNYKNSLMYF